MSIKDMTTEELRDVFCEFVAIHAAERPEIVEIMVELNRRKAEGLAEAF